MSRIVEVLTTWLENLPFSGQTLIVAFSGGRDSHVLLHALAQIQTQFNFNFNFNLNAIHVNHGLQPNAPKWASHCVELCEQYRIPFDVIELKLTIPPGESLEDIARQARYEAVAQKIHANHILLTAHTQDDQAETFLLQSIRGAGPKGLAGVAAWKKLGQGKLARPLLTVSRQSIALYAKKHKLQWIDDTSNSDLRFRRNFLRHEVLPVLDSLHPNVARCLARSATHCQQTQDLLDTYLAQELDIIRGEAPNTLKIGPLAMLSPIKQQQIIRYWLGTLGFPLPSSKKLKELLLQMLTAKIDATPCVTWANVQVRRFQGIISVSNLQPLLINTIKEINIHWPLHMHSSLTLPDGSVWRAILNKGKGIATQRLTKELSVRFRQGGERCQLAGKKHSQSLKKLFQSYGIPSWQRALLPLFYHDEKLISVGNLFICEGYQVQSAEEEGWVIERE